MFLHAVGVPPLRPLVSATNIGFMANMVLPLRIGEVIRPVLLSRRAKLPLSGVLASVLLERIFDMFTILFLFGVSVSVVTVSDEVRAVGMDVVGPGGGGRGGDRPHPAAGEAGAAHRAGAANLLPGNVGEQAYSFAEGFVRALEMLDSPMAYMRAFAWSIYLWMAISVIYVLGFWAFHMDVPALRGALVVTTLVAIAVSVPSAPGFIGSFQLGCVLGLRDLRHRREPGAGVLADRRT